ncbi:MAG: carbohydrate ABC transporter permease [Anaerolineae bacterium]|nr:carbohydrate ABC transporter permease [Anaerolineae bacterium]
MVLTKMTISQDILETVNKKQSIDVALIWKTIRRFILYILMILAVLWSVLPLAWVLISSLKPDTETYAFAQDQNILPQEPTFDNYQTLFKVTRFGLWLRNSTLMATGTTLAVVFFGAMAAYSLTRFKIPGFELFSRLTLIAYMMPPIILIVPLFFLLFRLGLVNSLWGLFLVYTATRLPFGIWLLRSYFIGIPQELEDAAMVDGATRFQAFYRVILPQALPGMISTGIFVFSVTWHEFLFASILLFSPSKQTLSAGVATFLSEDWIYSWGMLMAAGVMISLPLVLFYMFLQRYLIAGWGGGGLKG